MDVGIKQQYFIQVRLFLFWEIEFYSVFVKSATVRLALVFQNLSVWLVKKPGFKARFYLFRDLLSDTLDKPMALSY